MRRRDNAQDELAKSNGNNSAARSVLRDAAESEGSRGWSSNDLTDTAQKVHTTSSGLASRILRRAEDAIEVSRGLALNGNLASAHAVLALSFAVNSLRVLMEDATIAASSGESRNVS